MRLEPLDALTYKVLHELFMAEIEALGRSEVATRLDVNISMVGHLIASRRDRRVTLDHYLRLCAARGLSASDAFVELAAKITAAEIRYKAQKEVTPAVEAPVSPPTFEISAKILLLQAIERAGGYEAASRLLNCTRQNLYNLTSENSKKRPSIDMAFAIETFLGVPMSVWASKRKNTRKAA